MFDDLPTVAFNNDEAPISFSESGVGEALREFSQALRSRFYFCGILMQKKCKIYNRLQD